MTLITSSEPASCSRSRMGQISRFPTKSAKLILSQIERKHGKWQTRIVNKLWHEVQSLGQIEGWMTMCSKPASLMHMTSCPSARQHVGARSVCYCWMSASLRTTVRASYEKLCVEQPLTDAVLAARSPILQQLAAVRATNSEGAPASSQKAKHLSMVCVSAFTCNGGALSNFSCFSGAHGCSFGI